MLLAAEDPFRWQPHPEVWILVVGLVGLFAYATRVIGPRAVPQGTPPVTRSQLGWFALGIVLLEVAADWPLHDIAEEYLYSAHMFQHLLLTFVLPPVMLLATPEWLARLLLEQGRTGGLFLKLARPVPAAVVFNAIQLLTHWQVVVNGSVRNPLLHYALHVAVVSSATAVWFSVVGPLPERRISVPAQCIHLFLTSIVPTVPAAWLVMAEGAVYDSYDTPLRVWGISVTDDQQVAGLLMKLGGGGWLWLLIVVLFTRWVIGQDRGTMMRRVVAGADGRYVVVPDEPPAPAPAPAPALALATSATAGDAADADELTPDLTFEQVAEAFERSGPAPTERG